MSSAIEFNTSESWDFARRFAGLYGAVPSSFSSTIRGVMTDWERSKALSNGNRFQLLRLLKTASVKAPIYFAAATYVPDKIEHEEYIPPEGFLNVFTPAEICAMVGLVYLYRRGRKLTPEDEWPFVGGPTQLAVDLGGQIGFSIPAIGGQVSILGLGLWSLAQAAFLIHDKKGFVEHRRALKLKKVPRNEEGEMERWGCCAFQIATVLAQSLGFGVQFSEFMTRGLSPDTRKNPSLDKDAYRFAIAHVWADTLVATGKIPNIAHKGEFYPSKGAVTLLEEKTASLAASGSPFGWLDRGKEDVSPELTPSLFSAKELEKLASAPAEEGGEIDEILEGEARE